jgi:hypothetical protein
MELFGMENLHDIPTHPMIPENVRDLHHDNKEKVFHAILDKILHETFIAPLDGTTKVWIKRNATMHGNCND